MNGVGCRSGQIIRNEETWHGEKMVERKRSISDIS